MLTNLNIEFKKILVTFNDFVTTGPQYINWRCSYYCNQGQVTTWPQLWGTYNTVYMAY